MGIIKTDRSFWSVTFMKQLPEVFYEKKVFVKASQMSQENTHARVSIIIKVLFAGVVLQNLQNFSEHLF